MVSQSDWDLEKTVGLCVKCRHSHRIDSDKGPVYWLCKLSAVDDRFVKYPRLPVLVCAGYEPEHKDGAP